MDETTKDTSTPSDPQPKTDPFADGETTAPTGETPAKTDVNEKPGLPVKAAVPATPGAPAKPGTPAKQGTPAKSGAPAGGGTSARAAPAVKQPSRSRRAFTRGLRWTLILLIFFGAGILLALYAWYLPAVGQLQDANQKIADVESQTNERITSLQAEAQSLPDLQAQNETLKQELAQSELHVTILSARADVATAQLALSRDDPAQARMALSKTAQTLKTLETLLDSDQAQLATTMQDRLELALSEIDNDKNAAESDLNVLATKLLELDNAYFAKP